ncbi:hypothetical protein [Pseudorhodoferax sp.]|jgi:hypothetical protein|uniref:hypothetical protein n=1 Tax=Pseudorhodoferax sp. TaxID=1993553 RepID=UPI002DD68287|nr:hypothetical protein [Pseudorhodoferax sp.]
MVSTPIRVAVLGLLVALSPLATLHAQTAAQAPKTAKPAAKAPAAKPKPPQLVAAPGAVIQAKPKVKLMTRDELRACLDRQDASAAESKAIEADDKVLAEERSKVLLERDAIKAKQVEIETAEKTLLADNAAVAKRFEELKELLPKMSKKEQTEAKADYEARAKGVNEQIDPHNQRKKVFLSEVKAFEERVDSFNKRKDALAERADKLGDAQESWRNECGNKPYDEADEIALKKERAAAAAKPASQ